MWKPLFQIQCGYAILKRLNRKRCYYSVSLSSSATVKFYSMTSKKCKYQGTLFKNKNFIPEMWKVTGYNIHFSTQSTNVRWEIQVPGQRHQNRIDMQPASSIIHECWNGYWNLSSCKIQCNPLQVVLQGIATGVIYRAKCDLRIPQSSLVDCKIKSFLIYMSA